MKSSAESAALSCPMPCEIRTPRSPFAWLRSGALWVIGGRIAGIGLTLLANVVLARQLSPTEFGKFNLLSSVIALLSLLTMFGLSGAVVRFIPEQLAHAQVGTARRILRMSYFTLAIVWGVVAGIVWGGWPMLAEKYGLPTESIFILLVIASAGLIGFLQLTGESLRGFHELRFASLLAGGQTGGLLSNSLFVAMLLAWGTAATVSLQTALSLNVVALVVILPCALGLLWRTVVRQTAVSEVHDATGTFGESLRFSQVLMVCMPILLVQCVTLFSSQADIYIAGACCEQDLGIYSAARRMMLLVAMPLQMANFLVISSIAALKAKKQWAELEGLLQTAGILAAVPSLIALTLLIVGGGPILELLFGPAYREAALPLAILAVGQFALTWAGSSHTTLLMTGHQNVALAVNALFALLLFAGGTWAANAYGIVGLACASAGIVIIENLILMLLVRRLLGIKTYVPCSFSKWSERLRHLDSLGQLTTNARRAMPLHEEDEVTRAE